MALPILDGNQSATTLSSIVTSGEHIPAHTVVSLGTQAITNIATAVSGSVVSISNLPATQPVSIASVTIGSLPLIEGTVTANVAGQYFDSATGDTAQLVNPVYYDGEIYRVTPQTPLPVALATGNNFGASVTIGNSVTIGSLPLIAGTVTANPTGTQTIAGSVTLGAGTAQIGSVTASISNFPATQPVSIASVTIGSLPLIAGTVTANLFAFDNANQETRKLQISDGGTGLIVAGSTNIDDNPVIVSGTVTANTFAIQGTAVTTSNFTSTTASTLLAGFNAGREVLTIFNEGAGNLHICAGATCTTIAYQVRLSSGDYYEVPNHQTTITHSAVFQTAGTARVTEVS